MCSPVSEHFQQSCSDELILRTAVFLVFGFVSTQSQGFSNLLLHQSLAKNQKSSLLIATSFLSMLWSAPPKISNGAINWTCDE
jgi:hypothetical protein